MNRKILTVIPAMAIGLTLTMAGCSAPAANPTPAPGDSADPIIGEWTMRTLEFQTEGEFEEVPFSGQIIFTEAGTVAVQAQNPDAEAPDTAYTVAGYEAFYGDATVDPEEGTFSVDVTSAAARDLIGQTLERNYEVTGDTLVLTPVDASEGWRVTYDRATG